jgi:radical SAM superfamily enzyme YgiQ (UPF0313 family)
VSYPFCAQKCTYCNFASGVFPRELEGRYLKRLRAEIGDHAWAWTPETIYLGGGTPSAMDTRELAGLLALIPGRPWVEATLEVSPGSITPEKACVWAAAGVDRVSLGVQSFVQPEIARTGRKHSAEIVASDVATLRAAGIDSINIDLIAGLPGQTESTWRQSLDWIARLKPGHASIYMLEIDEDSRVRATVKRPVRIIRHQQVCGLPRDKMRKRCVHVAQTNGTYSGYHNSAGGRRCPHRNSPPRGRLVRSDRKPTARIDLQCRDLRIAGDSPAEYRFLQTQRAFPVLPEDLV